MRYRARAIDAPRRCSPRSRTPLIGLPLWKSHRAADLQVFGFGGKHPDVIRVGARKGQPTLLADISLHVTCAWRARGPNGIVVASRDRFYCAGPDPYLDVEGDWDWDVPGSNRRDERIRAWIESRSYEVLSVRADVVGGFAITLANGFLIEAFPDDSLDGEHWRIFDRSDAPHFVVSGAGIDDT